jgi:GntR family transcriptional regulator/MocR family aminotransferase
MSTGPLLALPLDRRRPAGRQLEQRLRELVGSGSLTPGTRLPSTRALAADLGVSRGVVVGAYAQLAQEGYLELRRGAAPVVAAVPRVAAVHSPVPDVPIAASRFNLRPDLPDLALFPRADWAAATRAALREAANSDLAYGEPFGASALRSQLAPFLARTRGVHATPERTAIFAGGTHALFVLASLLREQGRTRIAVEDPGHRWRTRALLAAGLEVVPVPVDDAGLRVEEVPDDVAAVVVSPDLHFPTAARLAPERRRSLLAWAAAGRLVVEHDHDAHFRYDRPPAGSLQALAPEHVAYVGSASGLLAPAVRVGWGVLPAWLVVPVANRLFATGVGTSRLTQLVLAQLIARGALDRHLRRANAAYRKRRSIVVTQLPRRLDRAKVSGAAAGLFVHVALPPGTDEPALLASARAGGIALDGVGEHTLTPQPPGLVVGFAGLPEPSLEQALRALGRAGEPHAIREARAMLESVEPKVVDNPSLRRYELWLGDRLAGITTYERAAGEIRLLHVEVDSELRNRGWGGELLKGVLADSERRGEHVRPVCPFAVATMRDRAEDR